MRPLSSTVGHTMIKRRSKWYALYLLIFAYCISVALIYVFSDLFVQGSGLNSSHFWAAILVAILIYNPILDIAMKMDIRRQCRKWGLEVLRIKTYKNHYRVYYLLNGEKHSGKWPNDFEETMANQE